MAPPVKGSLNIWRLLMSNLGKTLIAASLLLATVGPALADEVVLDPINQKFIDSLPKGGKPLYDMTPDQARAVLDSLQSGKESQPAVDIRSETISVGPTGKTNIVVVRPKGAQQKLPVVMYYHGGGWILGNFKSHQRLVSELSVKANAEVVFVDYTRSPEAKYPVALEQDYAATTYVASHADSYNIDASRMAIAGDSVGGNQVAVVSLMDKERQGPKISAQLLFYPVTAANFDDGSYHQFADGPWLTKKAMIWFWNAYEPDVAKRSDPHLSPLNATADQLRGEAPAMVITDQNDVLRDEGIAYAAKLADAGVRTVTLTYNGANHDFVMLNGLKDSPSAVEATEQGAKFLKEHLYEKGSK